MKPILLGVLLAVVNATCSKDKTNTAATDTVAGGTLKLSGMFQPTDGITVKGNAKLLSDGNSFWLLLENFDISAGPDLKVYLSKKDTPFEFVNLGPLKSGSGNQVYKVPAGVDFALHKYALIHCQQYNHLFAIAALKP